MRSVEDLLEPLAQMTKAGKLNWSFKNRLISDNANNFVLALSNYEVVIWKGMSPATGAEGVGIQILGEGKHVLDETAADEFSPRYIALKALFDDARRSANKVEAVVGDIERQLRSVAAA